MDVSAMSLEDIIKNKTVRRLNRFRNISTRSKTSLSKIKSTAVGRRFGVIKSVKKSIGVDARNKIIYNNRLKIRDARDKLIEITKFSGDARLKIRRLPQNVQPHSSHTVRKRPTYPPKHRFDVHFDKDLPLDNDEYTPLAISLSRTVKNDMALPRIPPLPTFYRPNDLNHFVNNKHMNKFNLPATWISDPFDCYEIPIGRPSDVSEPKKIQRQICNSNFDFGGSDLVPIKNIVRSTRNFSSPSSVSADNSHLSNEMRERLKHVPNSDQSMAIFSSHCVKPSHHLTGYRIVVSNLHNSVSQTDIKELFEDIGQLLEARLVRPGVAEVIFETMKDAKAAVDTYHNRQLDGQPMKCLLVNQRTSSKSTDKFVNSRS